LRLNARVMFVVSKSTGFIALCSFFRTMENTSLTVLILDDSSDIRSCFNDFTSFCRNNKIPFLVAKGGKCLNQAIEKFSPDTVFVCGWYWIIDKMILNKIPNFILGIHNSLLPKYRGHAPLVWSMLNGDKTVGASLFQIEEGMDTGKIYHQWTTQTENKYIGEVISDIECSIEHNFGKIFNSIINGSLQGKEQSHNNISFSSKRREADGLIEWHNESTEIVFKIKALSSPYPNAFMFIGDKKVILKKAAAFEYEVYGEPGQVVFICDSYAVICCANKTGVKITQAVGINKETKLVKLFSRLSSPVKSFE